MTSATPLGTPPARDTDAFVHPHALDAERAIIGAALIFAEAADFAADHLVPEDFFRRAHKTVFTVIRDLRRQDTAADLLTVKLELERRNELDAIGGAVYISSLTDGVPRSTNIAHYADVLRDLRAKRALIQYAERTLDYIAAGEHHAPALLEDADRRLIELQAGHVDGRLLPLSDSTQALFDRLAWRVEHRGEVTGVPTGFPSLDALTLGWQPGDLVIIAARPSIGKTSFAMNTVYKAATAGRHVAVFSLEMRRKQLEDRMLSSLSRMPLSNISSGHIMDADWAEITRVGQQMADLPVWLDDRSGQTAWEIRSACRRLKATVGLDLVVIDYVQLMPGTLERRGSTRNEEVTDISRRLKQLGDEVSCPILLLSQLSRANEKRNDPRPRLSDLRESGALEQDADVVCFLHRKNHRAGGLTNLILEKQRNGPTGTLNITLDRDTVTFTDGGEEEPAPAAPTLSPMKAPRVRRPRRHEED